MKEGRAVARSVYHVSPDGDDWKVTQAGSSLGRFDTKAEAIDFAVLRAKANEPSQVVVHRKDGTIEEEWTYGKDPFPPSG